MVVAYDAMKVAWMRAGERKGGEWVVIGGVDARAFGGGWPQGPHSRVGGMLELM
jgi:hypothetical protein